MNDKPVVSVVTPSYNQAEFLEHTINSVLSQDYPIIEYLIVDGGSMDGSVDIIRDYSSHLSWWVSEPDEGQASAINKGMSKASGEIVAWLNSDDLLLPGAINQAVRGFQSNPEVGIVYGNAITIDAGGHPIKELVFPDWELKDLIAFRIICQPAVFIKRSSFEQVSGLKQDYHFMLDHHLWVRIATHNPILHVPEMWAAARHHESAKNVSQAEEFGRETLEVLDWMGSQPELVPIIKQNEHQVLAGAYRLNARYLLDGKQYSDSLKSYAKAFLHQPGYTMNHWHRIIYAIFASLGGKNLDGLYARYQDSKRPNLSNRASLQNWPGLCL